MRHAVVDATDGKRKYNEGKFVIYVRQTNSLKENALKEVYGSDIIRFFGDETKIFTRDLVIDDRHSDNANRFKNKYNETENRYKEKLQLQKKEQTNNLSSEPQLLSIEMFRKGMKNSSQNLANSYHIFTKIHLLTNGMKEKEKMEYLQNLMNLRRTPMVQDKGEYFFMDKESNKICERESITMTTLAKCEHLRWCAAMEMLGYTLNDVDRRHCDLFTMKHNTMVSWDELYEIWKQTGLEYKQYDYNVVEASIELYLTRWNCIYNK